MAKIPTILAGGMSSGGSTGPTASPGAFGTDISGLMGGLNKVQQAGEAIGERNFSMQMKLAQLDEMRIANEAESHIKTLTSDFIANNKANEDAPNSYKAMMDEATKKVVANAGGNRELSMRIESMAGDVTSRAYDHLVAQSAGLKASRTAVSIIENNQVSLRAGAVDHETALVNYSKQIDEAFSDHPETAAKLKEQVYRDAVLFMANQDPERARAILDGAKEINGPTRHSLENVINTAQRIKTSVESDRFLVYKNDVLVGLKKSNDPAPEVAGTADDPELNPAEFNRLFGKDEGPRRYEHFKRDYFVALDVNREWSSLSSMPPGHQVEAIQALFSGDSPDLIQNSNPGGNTHRLEVRNELMKKAGESANYLSQNGAPAWLERYNKDMATLKATKDSAGNTWTQEQQVQYNNQLIALQSGTNAGSMRRTNAQLLTKDEATGWVAKINEAKNPDDVLAVVDGLQSSFPTTEQMSIALRDLDTLPGTKIDGNWRFLIQNRGAKWIRGYAEAITKNKAVMDQVVKMDDYKDFNQSLMGHVKPWMEAFGHYRAADASDLLSATKVFAAYKMTGSSPMTMNDAMEEATKQLTETVRPFSVNGFPSAVHADTPKDAEMVAAKILKRIDPANIDRSNFEKYLADKTPADHERLIGEAVSEKGHFEMSSDGKSMILVMRDEGGSLFSVRDTKGVPLRISFQDLNSIANAYSTSVTKFLSSPSDSSEGFIGSSRVMDETDYTLRDPLSNMPVTK